jgi:hypothetical protein
MSPPFSGSKSRTCYLLHAGFLIGSFFEPEVGDDMFLRKFGWISTDYTALYPRSRTPHNHRYENLKSYKLIFTQLLTNFQPFMEHKGSLSYLQEPPQTQPYFVFRLLSSRMQGDVVRWIVTNVSEELLPSYSGWSSTLKMEAAGLSETLIPTVSTKLYDVTHRNRSLHIHRRENGN